MNSSSVSNSPHLHCGFASASPEQSPCIIICMLWLSAAHLVRTPPNRLICSHAPFSLY